MEYGLVCQVWMVYPILWVLPFPQSPDRTKLFKMEGHVGYSKDHLPGELKIDKFESSGRNKVGALHGVSLKIGRLVVRWVAIPFVD